MWDHFRGPIVVNPCHDYIDQSWFNFLETFLIYTYCLLYVMFFPGGACGVMVIVVGNGHGDTSSNPGGEWLHFTLGKVWIQ